MSTSGVIGPAPLSQQLAALQAFVTAGKVSHGPGMQVLSRARFSEGDEIRAAWGQLKKKVFGNECAANSRHPSWKHDMPGFFAQVTFVLARLSIGDRLEALAKEEVSHAVLEREGVDPVALSQYVESGLLLEAPVRAFNRSAKQYV